MGRDRNFERVEDMAVLIDHYFNSITKTEPQFSTVIVGYEDEEQKKPIYEQRPILNNNGEQITATTYYEQPTVIALCKHIGISRNRLIEYSKLDEFRDTIKNAKDTIEDYLERQLSRREQVTGIIFNLKNNFDWKDKHDFEHTGTVAIKVKPPKFGDE